MCKMGIVGVPVLVVVNTFMNISCLDFHWANYMCSVQFNDYLIVFLPSAELFLNPCMALKKKTTLCNFTSDYIPSFLLFSFHLYLILWPKWSTSNSLNVPWPSCTVARTVPSAWMHTWLLACAETNRGQRSRLLNFQAGSHFLLQHTASFAFILYATHLSILWELGRDSKELGVGSHPKKFLIPITVYCINSLERHG